MAAPLDLHLNDKQKRAWRYLRNRSTSVIVYGGAAGGGKSFLAAVWLWLMMGSYEHLRFAVCRKQLLDVSGTFTPTFMKVVRFYGDDAGSYKCTLNGITNLRTGSQIIYLSLMTLPGDPEFNRLGSWEFTGAVVEEASDIDRAAVAALRTRIGRCRNNEIPDLACPKMLITCNPCRNWLYGDYYKKQDDPEFKLDKAFVEATSADNIENLPEAYVNTLRNIDDPILRARLLDGNWDYADLKADSVLTMSTIATCLTTPIEDGPVTLGIDVGGYHAWSDHTTVTAIKGNEILPTIVIPATDYQGAPFGYDGWLADKIVNIINSYDITNMKAVRIDASGIGAPIYELLRRKGYPVYPFRGDAKPIRRRFQTQTFANLRTQAFYELAEKFRLQKLHLPGNYNELLVQELQAYKYTANGDKLALQDKKFIRRSLGRSPDFADSLMMASFALNGQPTASSVKNKQTKPAIVAAAMSADDALILS